MVCLTEINTILGFGEMLEKGTLGVCLECIFMYGFAGFCVYLLAEVIIFAE